MTETETTATIETTTEVEAQEEILDKEVEVDNKVTTDKDHSAATVKSEVTIGIHVGIIQEMPDKMTDKKDIPNLAQTM